MVNYLPAFILGNPRSGTSLFRLMLNNHSNIVAPPEAGFAHWLLPKYVDWNKEHCSSARLTEFLSEVLSSKKFKTWNLSFKYLENLIKKNKPSNYADLIALIYMSYSGRIQDGQVIVDKNNYYVNHVIDLPKIWPNAKYIHLIRDGRDVLCSYLDVNNMATSSEFKPQFSSSIEKIAEEWSINNNRIAQIMLRNPERYLLIKYENLILDTEKELIKACNFLEVDFEQNMLKYFTEDDQRKIEPIETLDWKLKTKEKPDVNRVFRFKKILSKEQIEIFNSVAFEVLKKYNYE